jgi:hypothetical protein
VGPFDLMFKSHPTVNMANYCLNTIYSSIIQSSSFKTMKKDRFKEIRAYVFSFSFSFSKELFYKYRFVYFNDVLLSL